MILYESKHVAVIQ